MNHTTTIPRLTTIGDLDSVIVSYLADEAIGDLMRDESTSCAVTLHAPYTWYRRLCRVMDIDTEVTPLPFDASFDWRRIYHIMTCQPLCDVIMDGTKQNNETYYITYAESVYGRIQRLISTMASTDGTNQHHTVSGTVVYVCPHPRCDPSYRVVEGVAPPTHVVRTWSTDAVNMIGALIVVLIDRARRHNAIPGENEKNMLCTIVEAVADEGCVALVQALLADKIQGFPPVDPYYQATLAMIKIARLVVGEVPRLTPTPQMVRSAGGYWAEGVLTTLLRNPHCDITTLGEMWDDWMDIEIMNYEVSGNDDMLYGANHHRMVTALIMAIEMVVHASDMVERIGFLVSRCTTLVDWVWEVDRVGSHDYVHIRLMDVALGTRSILDDEQWKLLVNTVIHTIQAPTLRVVSPPKGLRSTDEAKERAPPFASRDTRYGIAHVVSKHFRRTVHSPQSAAAYFSFTRDVIAPLLGKEASLVRIGECYDAFLLGYAHGLLLPQQGMNHDEAMAAEERPTSARGLEHNVKPRIYTPSLSITNSELIIPPHGRGGWTLLAENDDDEWGGTLSRDAILMYCRGLFYHYAGKAAVTNSAADIANYSIVRTGLQSLFSASFHTKICSVIGMDRATLDWMCRTMARGSNLTSLTEFLYAPFSAQMWASRQGAEYTRPVGSSFREAEHLIGIIEQLPPGVAPPTSVIDRLSGMSTSIDWDGTRYAMRLSLLQRQQAEGMGEGRKEPMRIRYMHAVYDMPPDVYRCFKESGLVVPITRPKPGDGAEQDEGGHTVDADGWYQVDRVAAYVWNREAYQEMDG